MRVLGIDPGLATVGYGVIDQYQTALKPIDCGVITTPAGLDTPRRLEMVYDGVQSLIQRFSPDAVAIEELFFNQNITTAMTVSHARGAAVVAAAKCGRPLYEYTPLQVKQAVVGYGRAEKKQVQEMVRVLLCLKKVPQPDDAADALAVAICHIHCAAMGRRLQAGWER